MTQENKKLLLIYLCSRLPYRVKVLMDDVTIGLLENISIVNDIAYINKFTDNLLGTFEYNIDEAMKLLNNENVASANFGTINEYDDHDLEEYSRKKLRIEKIYGLRIFFALQRNELKTGEEWFANMYDLECKAEEIPEFRDIAFFHHIILRSTES